MSERFRQAFKAGTIYPGYGNEENSQTQGGFLRGNSYNRGGGNMAEEEATPITVG